MKSVTICVPRRRGWRIVAIILYETIKAYLTRASAIDFEMSES